MWRTLRQKILQINQATGIEVVFHPDEKFTIHTFSLKIEKGKPVNIAKLSSLNHFDDLCKHLPKAPVAVVFSGKGILLKATTEKLQQNNLLSAFLPGANPADFYTELTSIDNISIAAIVRKKLVDAVLEELKKRNIHVLRFFLGFSSIAPFLGYFNNLAEPFIKLYSYQLRLKGNQLQSFELIDASTEHPLEEYLVGQVYIQSMDILAYCAAAQLLADDLGPIPMMHEEVQQNRMEFIYGNFLKVFSFSLLAIIFLSLLFNFFVFTHYFNKNIELEVQRQATQKQFLVQSGLKMNLKKKEQFFEQAGWTKQSKTSFLADRFASFMPKGTWMTRLSFYPSSLSQPGPMDFKKDTILLTGYCDDPAQIHILISNIKTLKEIHDVTMQEYLYQKEEGNGNFSLQILLN